MMHCETIEKGEVFGRIGDPRASKSEEARAARVKSRMAALRAFQLKKAEKTASTTSSVCLPSDDVDTMES